MCQPDGASPKPGGRRRPPPPPLPPLWGWLGRRRSPPRGAHQEAQVVVPPTGGGGGGGEEPAPAVCPRWGCWPAVQTVSWVTFRVRPPALSMSALSWIVDTFHRAPRNACKRGCSLVPATNLFVWTATAFFCFMFFLGGCAVALPTQTSMRKGAREWADLLHLSLCFQLDDNHLHSNFLGEFGRRPPYGGGTVVRLPMGSGRSCLGRGCPGNPPRAVGREGGRASAKEEHRVRSRMCAGVSSKSREGRGEGGGQS